MPIARKPAKEGPMTADELAENARYFSGHYRMIVRRHFRTKRPQYLRDNDGGSRRLCRFCGNGEPEVTFKNKVHAVSEFLGNRSIISKNECDNCNTYFANNYEDHLGRWSLFGRTVSNAGKASYISPEGNLRVDASEKGVKFSTPGAVLPDGRQTTAGSVEQTFTKTGTSQPFVPIRAAMALIKAACSVCPISELSQCQPAIEWLGKRRDGAFSSFPVLYSTTPGPVGRDISGILLARRIDDAPAPYLWCVIQWVHHRLQAFVPFCPGDLNWLSEGVEVPFVPKHFPSWFPPEWHRKYGAANYDVFDWSSSEAQRVLSTVTVQITKAEVSKL